MVRGAAAAVLFALCAFSLAACSSTPSASGGKHHHHHSGSTTTTTTTSSSSTSSSTTTTSVPPACMASALSLGTTFGGTAAGTSYTVFTLTNNGDPCSLEGYPSLTFYGPVKSGATGSGSRIPITAVDSGPPATTVSLTKGGRAEFIIVYHDVPVGGVGCSTVASVDVSVPGLTRVLVASLSIPVCGGSVDVYAIGPPGSEHP